MFSFPCHRMSRFIGRQSALFRVFEPRFMAQALTRRILKRLKLGFFSRPFRVKFCVVKSCTRFSSVRFISPLLHNHKPSSRPLNVKTWQHLDRKHFCLSQSVSVAFRHQPAYLWVWNRLFWQKTTVRLFTRCKISLTLYGTTSTSTVGLNWTAYDSHTTHDMLPQHEINRLTPNNPYMGRTAPLTSKRCVLYIYSTNISTEYFKHALCSPFFSLQNAVCFIMLTCLVSVLFTFYIQGALNLIKYIIPAPKF